MVFEGILHIALGLENILTQSHGSFTATSIFVVCGQCVAPLDALFICGFDFCYSWLSHVRVYISIRVRTLHLHGVDSKFYHHSEFM